eukprot:Nitzschia sp. Nitz4//scaffold77_size91520//58861//59454//NITZ4_004897-RA/size91520-processed-gene-0.114-mRNA-1//-1//CDS//3329558012//8720//frame0
MEKQVPTFLTESCSTGTLQVPKPEISGESSTVVVPADCNRRRSSVDSSPSETDQDAVTHLRPQSSMPRVVALSQGSAATELAQSARSPGAARLGGNNCFTQNPRAKFLVLLNLLFKSLDQAGKPALSEKAKKLVAECTRRNRLGDPKFTPLMDVMERRLHRLVGDAHWSEALRHLHQLRPGTKGNTHFQQKSSMSRF